MDSQTFTCRKVSWCALGKLSGKTLQKVGVLYRRKFVEIKDFDELTTRSELRGAQVYTQLKPA